MNLIEDFCAMLVTTIVRVSVHAAVVFLLMYFLFACTHKHTCQYCSTRT